MSVFFWQAAGNWITSWSTHPRTSLPLPDEMWHKIVLVLSKDFKRDKDIMKREIRMLKDNVRMLNRELRHRLKLQKSLYGFHKEASQFFIPPSLFDAAFPYLIIILTMALFLAAVMFITITTTAAT